MRGLMNEAENMMEDMIEMRKKILDKHGDELKEMAIKEADIEKNAIEIKAKALKDGLTKDNIYCKYCGTVIDSDSIYCKNCGKKLI